MTHEQQALAEAFRHHLSVAGIEVLPDGTTEPVRVLIDEQQELGEPFQTARQKLPVYANITAIAGDVQSPRSVARFTDIQTGRVYRVIETKDNHDPTFNVWLVEVQRL